MTYAQEKYGSTNFVAFCIRMWLCLITQELFLTIYITVQEGI